MDGLRIGVGHVGAVLAPHRAAASTALRRSRRLGVALQRNLNHQVIMKYGKPGQE